MTLTMTRTEDPLRAVLRLRTLGPSGLNPPQTEVIDRMQTLSEDDSIADLDVDIWGGSMGLTQTEHRDPIGMRETMAEFLEWADAHGCTLRPAFEWRCADPSADDERQHGRVITPLITLAVYERERLQAVYPHMDGDAVRTIHDGVEALESRAGDADQPENEQTENPVAPLI